MSKASGSRAGRLRWSLREVGPLYTTQNLIKSVFPERVLRANTAFIVAADLRNRPPYEADPAIRWATEADVGLLAQSEATAPKLLEHFKLGAQIVVLARDGELWGYFIYRTKFFDQTTWLRYRMAPNVVWHSMAWTQPKFRGRRVHTHLQDFAFAELSRRGYTRMVASVDAVNISSLRSSTRECAVVGSVSHIRSGNLFFVWVNGCPRVGYWRRGNHLELDTDIFRVIPNRPYGPVDAAHFERLIGRRPS